MVVGEVGRETSSDSLLVMIASERPLRGELDNRLKGTRRYSSSEHVARTSPQAVNPPQVQPVLVL